MKPQLDKVRQASRKRGVAAPATTEFRKKRRVEEGSSTSPMRPVLDEDTPLASPVPAGSAISSPPRTSPPRSPQHVPATSQRDVNFNKESVIALPEDRSQERAKYRSEEDPRWNATSEGGCNVDFTTFSDREGLKNPELARELLKRTLLPKDWDNVKSRCIEEISDSVFSSALKVNTHTVLYLGLQLLIFPFVLADDA